MIPTSSNFLCAVLVLKLVANFSADGSRRCQPFEYKCKKSGKCIKRQHVLNDFPSCGVDDGSDEGVSPLKRCHPQTEFRCRKSGQCISRKFINVATAGCEDYSDTGGIENFPCGTYNEFRCLSGNCLPRYVVNNKVHECFDGSDEGIPGGIQCHQAAEYKCADGGRCIMRHKVLDGMKDCPGGDDELKTSMIDPCAPSTGEFRCGSGRCIPRWMVGDDIPQCRPTIDSEDEVFGAIPQCNASSEFTCGQNGTSPGVTQCIPISWVNDGLEQCADGTDERVATLNCTSDDWACDDQTKCISRKNLCDGILDCDDCSDETDPINCENNTSRFFKCSNPKGIGEIFSPDGVKRSHCIYRSYFCDGVVDCADGSDEIQSGEGFKCRITNAKSGHTDICVLPSQLINDDVTDCDDGSDELRNTASQSGSFCLSDPSGESGSTILKTQLCDGVFDCNDLTDECLCHVIRGNGAKLVCDNLCLYDLTAEPCVKCKGGFLQCEMGGKEICVPISSICDGVHDCNNGSDETACHYDATSFQDRNDVMPYSCPLTSELKYFAQTHYREVPREAKRCDGIPECFNLNDECDGVIGDVMCPHVSEMPPFCEHLADVWLCDNDTKPLPPKYICDGMPDCQDGIDEKYCHHMRFYCDVIASSSDRRKLLSIRQNQVCDGFADCVHWTDEKNCSNHFYCRDKLPPYFVNLNQVLDGLPDCTDRSDECPNDDEFTDDPLSSRDQMIKHKPLKIWMLLMALVAIVGNLCVIVSSARRVFKSMFGSEAKKCCSGVRGQSESSPVRPMSSLAKSNDILVLNLAVADLLTGFYLLLIAVKSQGLSRFYCVHQLAWRSSDQCNNLGVLVLTSCQASIGMMVILTTYRLYAVIKPWSVMKIRIKVVIGWIAITWAVATLWGILPITLMLEDAFVTSSIISNKDRHQGALYFPDLSVTKSQLGEFVRKACLLVVKNGTNEKICNDTGADSSWHQLREASEHLVPGLLTNKTIGYYGAHGVCLPSFFHTNSTGGTIYTLVLMAFNFVAFAYIAIAYVCVWRKSSGPKNSDSAGNEASEGHKRKKTASAKRVGEMHKRIFRLILTDFICWVPVCILSFCGIAGIQIPPVVYSLTAAILLPLNSALNPVLYSDVVQTVSRAIVQRARFVITGSIRRRKASFPFTSEKSNSLSNLRRASLKPEQINNSTPQVSSPAPSSGSFRERLLTLVTPRGRDNHETTAMRTQMSEIETSHVQTRHIVATNQQPAATMEALIKKTTTL